MDTLKKTPLNPNHRALGAKMVDFGGWDMPLHYGSQIEEHHAVRNHCGMFDVSHMRALDIQGDAAKPFLRYLLANNVDKLKTIGKALYSVMLNPTGGVIDDLIVYFLSDTHYRVVVNAGTAEKDIAWIQSHIQESGMKVECRSRDDLAIIALQGPKAKEKLWEALPHTQESTAHLKPFFCVAVGDYFISTTGYTGEEGFEITLPSAQAITLWETLLRLGVAPIGLGARDTLRLEAGMNLYGQDMDETTSPLDTGLAWTLDMTSEREFIGKAALLAHTPQTNLLGLLLIDRGILRAHQRVITDKGEGEVTSGTFSPSLQQSIGLARLPRDVAVGDTVQVEIRDKRCSARVIKPCFVRHGKSLIA